MARASDLLNYTRNADAEAIDGFRPQYRLIRPSDIRPSAPPPPARKGSRPSFEEMRAMLDEIEGFDIEPAPAPSYPAKKLADLSLTSYLISAEERDEEEGEVINAKVRATWGSLSRPEPKSIYSPAPPSPTKREERKNWPPGPLRGAWYNR